jgi:hypothetical protein
MVGEGPPSTALFEHEKPGFEHEKPWPSNYVGIMRPPTTINIRASHTGMKVA